MRIATAVAATATTKGNQKQQMKKTRNQTAQQRLQLYNLIFICVLCAPSLSLSLSSFLCLCVFLFHVSVSVVRSQCRWCSVRSICRSIFNVTLRFIIKGVIFYEVIQLLTNLFITRNNLTPFLSLEYLAGGWMEVRTLYVLQALFYGPM